jgi:glyoxylase-like metal-dependent hydrolase (beta-lactamase superfamily II)
MVFCAAGAFGDYNMFQYSVGPYNVYTMVETVNPGNDGILIGASDELKAQYLAKDFKSEINAFLIKGNGKTILVDTGFGGIFINMDRLKIKPAEVNYILLTHLHGDHISGLSKRGFAFFPNAIVLVAEQELKYWTETKPTQSVIDILAPYGTRLRTFNPEEIESALTEIVPGITAVAAYGHTPGHTCFLLQYRRERILITGDLMHIEALQLPRPDISVTYDVDPVQAAATRKKILAWAAENKCTIAGMHLLSPAMGKVADDGKGGYKLNAVEGSIIKPLPPKTDPPLPKLP